MASWPRYLPPMHELSVAEGVLDIVRQYVAPERAAAVRGVRVKVGVLSGVMPESLDFSFSAIVADTPWQHATLEIERVPAVCRCDACTRSFEIEEVSFLCPHCDSTAIHLTSGQELQVMTIDVDDEGDESR